MRSEGLKQFDAECRGCGNREVRELLSIPDAPVDCSIRYLSGPEAQAVARGDIHLGFCESCGLISNFRFDLGRVAYNPEYENSLDASPRFRRYSESVISRLVEVHGLRGKRVIEIGCGNGAFLRAVCAAGNNSGTGFDPACDPSASTESVTLIQDLFTPAYSDVAADLVVCRHVLEHIPAPEDILRQLRRHPGLHSETVVYFEVPNTDWILDEMRLWDVIYPHCSYFTATTLTDLFRRCGFSVLRAGTSFGDQFLFVEAVPRREEADVKVLPLHDTRFLANRADRFRNGFQATVKFWDDFLRSRMSAGRRVVAWGGGAKAVMFTHLVSSARRLAAFVDINPRKQNTCIPGSGLLIESPEVCRAIRPDVVLVMNPIYETEIREMLLGMGVDCEVVSIRDDARNLSYSHTSGGA